MRMDSTPPLPMTFKLLTSTCALLEKAMTKLLPNDTVTVVALPVTAAWCMRGVRGDPYLALDDTAAQEWVQLPLSDWRRKMFTKLFAPENANVRMPSPETMRSVKGWNVNGPKLAYNTRTPEWGGIMIRTAALNVEMLAALRAACATLHYDTVLDMRNIGVYNQHSPHALR